MSADLDTVRRLVAGDHGLAVVSVTRRDGSVHTSLVNAGVIDHPASGEPVAAFVVAGDARKLRLMRASGRCALTFRVGWDWAGVEGPVHLIGPDDALAGVQPSALPGLLREVFRAAGGTHDDWDEFDRVMADERRAVVVVEPARLSSNADPGSTAL